MLIFRLSVGNMEAAVDDPLSVDSVEPPDPFAARGAATPKKRRKRYSLKAKREALRASASARQRGSRTSRAGYSTTGARPRTTSSAALVVRSACREDLGAPRWCLLVRSSSPS